MPIWEAVLLGVIQGVTEFLPISSTAHLVVARTLLGHDHPEDAFTVVIQLGTLAAVFVYFRADVARMLGGLVADINAGRLASTPDSRLGWLIVLGTVPAVVCGFLFKKQLKAHFFTPTSIAVVAIVYALLMGAAEWWAHRRTRLGRAPRDATAVTTDLTRTTEAEQDDEVVDGRATREEKDLTWVDALWIGAWQACALMPGGSRSGTTITGGLFAGLSRPAAARFSFLMSLPIMLGAGFKELYDEYKQYRHPKEGEPPSLFASGDEVAALVVGTLVSFVVGYFAIAFLLNFLRRYSMDVFVAYRLLLGTAIFVLIAQGYLKT
jgi:undecaprenyl-diphosphatase